LLPGGFGTPDDARAALLFIAAVWFCVVLASGGDARVARPGISYWPLIGLFLAGSVVDVALAPSDTLIGPILVTVWYAVTASNPDEATSLYLIAAGFAALTVASVARPGGLVLAPGEGGIARSTAFGLLLVTVGLLTAHRTSGKPRASAPAA
jgi:hypothetical protein